MKIDFRHWNASPRTIWLCENTYVIEFVNGMLTLSPIAKTWKFQIYWPSVVIEYEFRIAVNTSIRVAFRHEYNAFAFKVLGFGSGIQFEKK